MPAGLLWNGRTIRLISAPPGESSGWIDFQVADMLLPAGRPICTALRLLLNERRLLALPRRQRLAALLGDSRRYQNEVSERLAEQVLHALYELLRGFQAAHDLSKGDLLNDQLRADPDGVYRGLLAVVLRLVFLLYAEERGLLSEDETFVRHYSLAGLHDRLRADAALHPDTMDQRYGAWAGLLALFRMIHNGARGKASGCRRATASCSIPTATRSSKDDRSAAWPRTTNVSTLRWFPTARSAARSTSCWCSTASVSPTERWTSNRSAPCTRR